MIRLIRRYEFSAAHVLARRDWEPERNRAVYGKCANPHGHGHNYRFELTLEGSPDPATGELTDLAALDEVVASRVLVEVDGRFLNRDVGAFEAVVPTAENIARHIWDRLEGALGPTHLAGVRLIETDNNSVEYFGSEREP